MKFQMCFKFQGCSKKVFRVLQGRLKLLQESFKGVSRKIKGDFESDYSGFQGYLKELQREFQGSFKDVSRKFQGCSRIFFRMFQGRLKGVSIEFQVDFKNV